LIGRVREVVSPREVWVELLTAPDLALGCELERNGLLGILRPRGGDFILDMVGRDEDVRVGDRVLTSGIAELAEAGGGEQTQALFPRGLPVGVVQRVESPADQLFLDISVAALASLRRSDVVFVVTEPGEWFLEALVLAEPDTAASGASAVDTVAVPSATAPEPGAKP
jgi:rod shape-determining protein MreC